MNKVYSKDKFIAYNNYIVREKKAPYVIFLHGLMSDMNGQKALVVEKHCRQRGFNFIRFDNFGHGASSGKFTEETISTWSDGLDLVINELTGGAPILLVGSSMGGWTALLGARKYPEKVIGVLGIAAAPDFTEELLWDKMTEAEKDTIQKEGICNLSGQGPACNHIYPISHNLILDGRKHLLLQGKQINIACPVHLIHGMEDVDVPSTIATRIAERLKTKQVVLKLIKDGGHRLSRPEDLKIITNSIDELLL